MSEQGGRPVRTARMVLADALHELQEREARLAKLEREILETRAGIEALQAVIASLDDVRRPVATPFAAAPGERPALPAGRPAVRPRRPPVRGEARDALDAEVLALVGELQPVSPGTLMERTGLMENALSNSLLRLRVAGKVALVGNRAAARYWLPDDVPKGAEITLVA